MIDPLKETVLNLAKAARRLPRLRGDRPVAPSTLHRWATQGCRGVKLETCRLGGTTITSLEALGRFFDRLNGGAPPETSPADRERRAAAAERELAEQGI